MSFAFDIFLLVCSVYIFVFFFFMFDDITLEGHFKRKLLKRLKEKENE